MKIAFFGSSLVSSYWNGAATYYRGIIKSLHNLGHRVTFFESDAFDRQRFRDVDNPFYAESVVYRSNDEKGVLAALQLAREFDLVVKASGVGVFDDLLETAVLELRHEGISVIYWDVDAPATLTRIARDPDDHFRALVPEYDLVLTYGGGQRVQQEYRELGARQCIPIYNGVDPEVHYPVAPDGRFDAFVGFLGNRLPDREERVEDFFFSPVRTCTDKSFIIGGSGWSENSLEFPNLRYLGHVRCNDHNAFNSSVQVAMNISRQSMATYGSSPATRMFEAAGAAACMITDHWPGIEDFFEPDRECYVIRSGEEATEILRIITPASARTMGVRARERVLGEHTYDRRAIEVEQALDQIR